MLAAHCTVPFRQRFNNAIGYIKVVNQYRRRHNINNGVHCTNFVKMHFLHWATMCLCFGFGDNAEYFLCQCRRPLRQPGVTYYMQHICQIAMNMFMAVFVIMPVIMPVIMVMMFMAVFMIMPVIMVMM